LRRPLRTEPNPFVDYEWETFSYLEYDNYFEGLKSYLKYLELKPPELDVSAVMLNEVFRAFNETGFYELARSYAEKYLTLTQDYDRYYYQMLMVERWQGNYRAEQKYIYRWWELDNSSTSTYFSWVSNYIYLNKLDSAYHYLQLLEADRQRKGQNLSPNTVYGYVYMKLGQKSEAEYHLKGSLSYWKKNIKLKTPNAQKGTAYFWLVLTYSILEDGPNTIKHLEYLKEFSTLNNSYYTDLKDLSCFDFVRNTPEFQSVLKHLEKVNRKEHRRIARLLKQQGYPFSQETNW